MDSFFNQSRAYVFDPCTAHQSVSKTTAVCPRNSGIRSGNRPRSFVGMTANAPPPLLSQLTARYSGLACKCQGAPSKSLAEGSVTARRTLIKLVSHAFLEILRLS